MKLFPSAEFLRRTGKNQALVVLVEHGFPINEKRPCKNHSSNFHKTPAVQEMPS
jgi:hypothetical protein